jgi:hypothetical protein
VRRFAYLREAPPPEALRRAGATAKAGHIGVTRESWYDSLPRFTNMNQKDRTVKYDGVEKRIGLAEPDIEAKMKRIPMVTSHSPVLCYETLPFFGKKSQRSFSVSSVSDGFQT